MVTFAQPRAWSSPSSTRCHVIQGVHPRQITTQRNVPTRVGNSIIHNSQKVQAIHMSLDGCMDTQNVVHPDNRILFSLKKEHGFPGGLGSKESAHNARNLGLIPGLRRSLGGGHGNPLQYSCPENPHGQRSVAGYSPWGRKVRHPERLSTQRSTKRNKALIYVTRG